MVKTTTSEERKRVLGSEAGYNMVILVVAVAILSILLAAALPMWSTARQRENEAELIFRGWQYAEAIRVFQQRHGRLPTRLEELLEVEPRSIRRLWKDPMTENGKWALVFQGGIAPEGGGGQELGGSSGLDDGRGDRRPGRGGDTEAVGPIIGVHSRATGESFKVLFGETSYDKWTFTVERLGAQPQGAGQQLAAGGGNPAASSRPTLPRAEWIGKPFPAGLEAQGGLSGQPSQPGQPGWPATGEFGPDGQPRRPAPPPAGRPRPGGDGSDS